MRSFALSVSVPPALLVRQRGAWLHLRQHQQAGTAQEAGAAAPGGSATDGGATDFSLVEFGGVVDVKDPLRWLLSPRLAALLSRAPQAGGAPSGVDEGAAAEGGDVRYDPSSPLTLTLSISHPACSQDHEDVVAPMLPSSYSGGWGKRQKKGPGKQGWKDAPDSESTRTVLELLRNNRLDARLAAKAMVPPPVAQVRCAVRVAIERAPLCLKGHYLKYSRSLPQTPWIMEGERKRANSVQECIEAAALRLFGADEAKFHAAGREDVDVRMLGEGRPFVLELLRPKRPYRTSAAEMNELEAEINASQQLVRVRGLAPCASELISGLVKQGEDSHRKDYRCIVRVSRRLTPADVAALNGARDVLLQQKTPLRVLHRRTQMVRPRMVYEMHAVQLAPRFLQLDLCTQAGTYVKEFVHSDFGRTHPSVGSLLGCEADIMQLDVLGLREPGDK